MKKFRYVGLMILLVMVLCLALTACNKATLTGITLNTDSVSKNFTVGDAFNYNGLVVTANYSNDASEVVTDFTVSKPDMTTAGNKTVTVTYQDKTASYQITVKEPAPAPSTRVLESITLDTENVQKQFTAGDTFNHDNLVVTAHYNEAPLTEVVSTGYTVSTPNMQATGAHTVTVTYMGKTATYSINVSEPVVVEPERELQSISIETDSVQKVFFVGDEFSYEGLVVTAHYNVAPLTEVISTGYTVSPPDMNTADTYTVTVSYMQKTATYEITVKEPALTSITVDTNGAITVFMVGSQFSYAGIVVTAHYENGNTQEITSGYDVNTDELDMDEPGTYTITVTYLTKEATYEVTVKDAALVKIEVDYSKATTTFFVGDEFSYEGLVVTAYYDDDSSYEVTGYTVSEPNMDEANESLTVTVQYQGKEATYQITVKEPALTHITVEEGTAKVEYFVGDEFSYEGIVVYAHYENNKSVQVTTGYSVTTEGLNMNEPDTYTITVTYMEKTATYTITVREPALTSISVNADGAKKEFCAGDTFSYDGIVVTAHYENNKTRTLEKGEYTVTPPNMDQVADNVTVTVTYNGETATYTITLTEPVLTDISVDASGAKKEFYVGDTFSYNGIVVTADYENGWSQTIEQGYTVTPPDMTTIGDKQVVVSYKDKQDQYNVTVQYKIFEQVYNGEELRLEAEDAWLQGKLNAQGTFVGGISNGDKLTFMFNSAIDGAVELYLSMGHANDVSDAFHVYVNDPDCETKYSLSITHTGGWTTMKEFKICKVNLKQGLNTVEIVANSTSINIDYLLISPDNSSNPDLDYITVNTDNAKTEYYVGEKFSYQGIVVTAYYTSGEPQIIEKGYEVSTPDMSTEGSKTVTVTYGEKSVSYQITVSYKVFGEEYNGESVIYEAEDSTLEGNLLAENDGSVHGGKRVSGISSGDKLTFKFNSNVAATVELYLAMGYMGDISNAFYVYVNDPNCATQYSVGITNTGGWTKMEEFFICRVDLVVGLNTVVIVANSKDINLDYLRVAPDSSSNPDVVLERIEVDTTNATTVFNIREEFSTEGLVVKAWYSNKTYVIVTEYQIDTPDMTTTGIKKITVTYQEMTATYEITVKDPSVPDPAWDMTKISLKVEDESVYLVFSGTFVSYNQEDLQATLYAALQWDLKQDTWATPSSALEKIFVYGDNTWEIKIEITVGSLGNFMQIGRYFIDKTNPDNDKVGLYAGKWTIGESIELGSYKYEFCEDTFYSTLTFRISKILSDEPQIYDGSDFEVGPSKAELQGGGELQQNGLGASEEGSIIGNIGAGCIITFTVTSNGAASVNLKVFLSSGAGHKSDWSGWSGEQLEAFEIYVNGVSVGKFDGKGGGYVEWDEYLVENLSLNDGENTIEIRFLQGNANFSHLVISPAEQDMD